jgi:hypothetical protein
MNRLPTRPIRLTLLALLSLAVVTPTAWAACNPNIPPTKPDSRYLDGDGVTPDGTVTDTVTGLMWKKCSEGQTWNSGTNACDGGTSTYTWRAAHQRSVDVNAANAGENLGHADWRVPNLKELKSLAETACYSPAINENLFPGTPSNWYWSSSPDASDAYDAWVVYFYYGTDGWNGKVNAYRVRLVRAGQ